MSKEDALSNGAVMRSWRPYSFVRVPLIVESRGTAAYWCVPFYR